MNIENIKSAIDPQDLVKNTDYVATVSLDSTTVTVYSELVTENAGTAKSFDMATHTFEMGDVDCIGGMGFAGIHYNA